MKALRELTASETTVSRRFSVLVILRDTDTLGVSTSVAYCNGQEGMFSFVFFSSATILGVSGRHALHTEAGGARLSLRFP